MLSCWRLSWLGQSSPCSLPAGNPVGPSKEWEGRPSTEAEGSHVTGTPSCAFHRVLSTRCEPCEAVSSPRAAREGPRQPDRRLRAEETCTGGTLASLQRSEAGGARHSSLSRDACEMQNYEKRCRSDIPCKAVEALVLVMPTPSSPVPRPSSLRG